MVNAQSQAAMNSSLATMYAFEADDAWDQVRYWKARALQAERNHQALANQNESLVSDYNDLVERFNAGQNTIQRLHSENEKLVKSYNSLLGEYNKIHGLFKQVSAKYKELHQSYQQLFSQNQNLHAEHQDLVAASQAREKELSNKIQSLVLETIAARAQSQIYLKEKESLEKNKKLTLRPWIDE